MSSQEIADLQQAVAGLRQDFLSLSEATHATLHLLAFTYTTRCLSVPDPMAEYKHIATVLLGSLGAMGDGELPVYPDKARDALAQGLRHHVGQFLLSLRAHLEANLKAKGRLPTKVA